MPAVQPVQTPNYANLILQGLGAFSQVQRIGANQATIKNQEAQSRQRQEIADLRVAAANDPEALKRLAALDPASARSLQQFQQGGQQFQQEQDESFRRDRALIASEIENLPVNEQVNFLDERISFLNQQGQDTTRTQRLREMLGSGDPQQIMSGQQAIFNARVAGEQQGILKVPAQRQGTALARNIELLKDPNLSEEERNIVLANLLGTRQKIEVGADGTITFVSGRGVDQGGAGLQKRTKGEIEKSLVGAERSVSALGRLEKQFDRDFLTFQGRGKAFLSNLKSKAGIDLDPDERAFIKNRRKFTQNVNQFFNAYRKEITGAAASMLELSSLKKAIFNESLSPDEFQSAFEEFKSEVLRAQRVNRKLLREGVSGNLKNKKSAISKRFDQEFTGGADDGALDRIEELKETKTEDEIFNILEKEGYDF